MGFRFLVVRPHGDLARLVEFEEAVGEVEEEVVVVCYIDPIDPLMVLSHYRADDVELY